jgi:hypothetical protein
VRFTWILLLIVGCAQSKPRQLDLDRVRISTDARLRTDSVGEGKWEEQATFVLVDCDNTGSEGAYITLGGTLADHAGAQVSELKAQSLYVPAGATRTFALVDAERQARPTASAARLVVRGATIPDQPPPYRVDAVREVPDNGKLVLQGTLHNDAERGGDVMVIAAFRDESGRLMTRPFSRVFAPAHGMQGVQFVGPAGSVHGTIFVGDAVY